MSPSRPPGERTKTNSFRNLARLFRQQSRVCPETPLHWTAYRLFLRSRVALIRWAAPYRPVRCLPRPCPVSRQWDSPVRGEHPSRPGNKVLKKAPFLPKAYRAKRHNEAHRSRSTTLRRIVRRAARRHDLPTKIPLLLDESHRAILNFADSKHRLPTVRTSKSNGSKGPRAEMRRRTAPFLNIRGTAMPFTCTTPRSALFVCGTAYHPD